LVEAGTVVARVIGFDSHAHPKKGIKICNMNFSVKSVIINL